MVKEKGKSFSYQWYPKDILSSVSVSMLSLAEEGAYRRALDFCWLNEGLICSDVIRLSKIIGKGCTKKIAEKVKTFFVLVPGDESMMFHERLDLERKKQNEWRAKSSKAGQISAQNRKDLALKRSTNVQPTFNQDINQNHTLPFPLSSSHIIPSSPEREEEKKEKKINGPSEVLVMRFASQHMLKAKSFGMPHDKIPEELEKFDEHHFDFEFVDEKHVLNSWGLWCSKYQEKLLKPKTGNLFKKAETKITKPTFNNGKTADKYD
jgi:uncharacterized protein YdaU (DUF1376 family)